MNEYVYIYLKKKKRFTIINEKVIERKIVLKDKSGCKLNWRYWKKRKYIVHNMEMHFMCVSMIKDEKKLQVFLGEYWPERYQTNMSTIEQWNITKTLFYQDHQVLSKADGNQQLNVSAKYVINMFLLNMLLEWSYSISM